MQQLQEELYSAIEKGEIFKVINLLDSGANPNSPRAQSEVTPLEYCILKNQFNCFKTIGAKGGDINIIVGQFKMSLLHFATLHGRYEIAWYLKAKGLDTQKTDLRGFMPIHYAAAQNWKFYTLFAEKNSHRFAKSADEALPIHAAAFFGNTAMVQTFIEQGNLPYERDKYDKTPLHYAAENGHLSTVQFLCDNGCSKHYWNKLGETAFHTAAKRGHKHIMQYLAQPEKKYNLTALHGISALHLAAKGDHVDCCQFLCTEGRLDPFLADDKGRQPIHFAALCDATDAFNYFLSFLQEDFSLAQPLPSSLPESPYQPAKSLTQKLLDIKDKKGETVVTYAAKAQAKKILQRLVELHVDIGLPGRTGATAMHFAANAGDVEFMKCLHANGLSYTQADSKGMRPVDAPALRSLYSDLSKFKMHPLFAACLTSNIEQFDLLMATGLFDLYTVDDKGWNCLHHAAHKNQPKMIEHLRVVYKMESKHKCKGELMAIHHAALSGAIDALQMLNWHGDSYEEVGKTGARPIHFACTKGHIETFRFLVGQKAELHAVNAKGQNCVFYAAFFSNIELLQIMAHEFSFDITGIIDYQKSTPLHVCLVCADIKTIKFLRGRGASITAINAAGKTPVELAQNLLLEAEQDPIKNEAKIDRLKPIVKYLERENGQRHVLFKNTASLETVHTIPSRSPEDKAATKAKRKNQVKRTPSSAISMQHDASKHPKL